VTLLGGLPTATLRAGPFWPIAAALVGHYALAWLSPRFVHSAKTGSVTIIQIGRKAL
jgi:hypothetical protein